MKPLTEATAKLLKPASDLRITDQMDVTLTKDGKKFHIQLYDRSRETFRRPSPAASGFMQRFPERTRLDSHGLEGESWNVGATDHSAEIIRQAWPIDQVEFDEHSRTVYQYLLLNGQRQAMVAEQTAKFRESKELPNNRFFDLELHPEFTLSKYQQLACGNSMHNEGFALFMEQGTGKTPTVIARVMNEAARIERKPGNTLFDNVYKVLIVCPNQVRFNWEQEFVKFSTRTGQINRVWGGPLWRKRRLAAALRLEPDDEFMVVIVGYGTMKSEWESLGLIPWDLAVLDESHYIKNSKTARWKYAMKLRDRARSRMLLTGTPIANTPMDLYAQWEFLGEGASGFTSFDAYKRFFGVYETRETGMEALVAFQNTPFMQERLAKQSFMIKKEEALPDLPAKVYDTIEVELTQNQRDVYAQVATRLFAEIDEELTQGEGGVMQITNILTRMLRLSQITSGHLSFSAEVDDDGVELTPARTDYFSPNPKLDQLVEELKAKKPEQKTLIWSNYTTDIRTIKQRLDEEFGPQYSVCYYGGTKEADRDEAVRRLNEDFACKAFIGNPRAGGAGLNLLGYPVNKPRGADLDGPTPGWMREAWPQGLTCPESLFEAMMAYDQAQEQGFDVSNLEDAMASQDGHDRGTYCDHVIYFSKGWSSTDWLQSQDRAHRRGTRTNVRISSLIAEGTIDEQIHERVLMKVDTANSIQDLREVLAGVFAEFM